MKTKKLVIIFLLFTIHYMLYIIFLGGCGKKKTEPVRSTEKVSEVAKVVAPEPKTKPTKVKKVVYVYQGHRFRDPFIPLTGEGMSILSRRKEKMYIPNLRSLILKGIFEDVSGIVALITDAEGKSFYLKEGRLLDPEGKIVPGISGVVKKGKVILSTAGTKIELEIKEVAR